LILKRRREADPDRKLAASFVGEIGEVEPPEAKPAVKTTSFQKLSKWIRSGGRKS
jgi:hypothetical protein